MDSISKISIDHISSEKSTTTRSQHPQRHISISVINSPAEKHDESSAKTRYTRWTDKALNVTWRIFDTVVLLQMGSVYLIRFHEFALAADGRNNLPSIAEWRNDQQAEWNRLSTTLALLATMHAAILAVSPQPPNLAFSLWLGGGALSVCGLFTVQYFPIRAFSMTDEDLGFLVENDNEFVSVALLATAVASPVVICLWAALLFVAGMIDYILETEMGGVRYRVFAAVPIFFGIIVVVMTLVLGESIDRRMREKYYPQGLVMNSKDKGD